MLREGEEEMSGRFKQTEAVGRPGLRERLPSVWLRRKGSRLEDCLPLWSFSRRFQER